jgi:phthiocerol/phenolphthiocerol synthesis type-I polyketide synthase E
MIESHGVAVIGLSLRVPGARDAERFWAALVEGTEGIRDLTDDELQAEGVPGELLAEPGYVRRGAPLDGLREFDAEFFGITPGEARVLDPQQRLLLQESWHALEDAGRDPRGGAGATAVFLTTSISSYLLYNLLPGHDLRLMMGGGLTTELVQLVGENDPNFAATRVSYTLNLRGPSVTLQTACSSSLVAVHLACQSLLDRECDTALAGGASVRVPHRAGYLHDPGSVMSPDGRCRPFDAAAAGTVFGSGVVVLVLRRLQDALSDGDPIRAVILGSAMNNDGSLKMGFTAPSVTSQAEVIAEALEVAGVDPDAVGYIETHGTATPLGDPVEVAALAQAYGPARAGAARCRIGSVKGNVGHLEVAAGATGLAKTVLAVERGVVPGTLHFRAPNPELHLHRTRFEVRADTTGWPLEGPRRAAVSALGVGGTNVHVVVGQAPPSLPRDRDQGHHVLALSARDGAALTEAAHRLADRLEAAPEIELRDVARTLSEGRSRFEHRQVVVASDPATAVAGLRGERADRSAADQASGPSVVFLFPGQGSQYQGMIAGLVAADPLVRAYVERCAGVLRRDLGADVRDLLADARIQRTDVLQPVLFTVEYALAKACQDRGVVAEALAGHSVGEYVAACIAGVLTLPEALAAVVERGRLMAAASAGAMVSVRLPEDDALTLAET